MKSLRNGLSSHLFVTLQKFSTFIVIPVLANVEDAVLLVAESLGWILLAELLYYGDGRLKSKGK